MSTTALHPMIDRLAALPRGHMLSTQQVAEVLGKGYAFANALLIEGKISAVAESAGAGGACKRQNRDRRRNRYDVSPLSVILYLIDAQRGKADDLLAAVAVHFPALHAACTKHAERVRTKQDAATTAENVIDIATGKPRKSRKPDPFAGAPEMFDLRDITKQTA